eukprot:Lithocolla_globosa_v1_NODE_7539_length_933_cov_5.620729.p1 type:complete len:263 gc:universal NODE_7539_length_933_cov_5.620729:810-22(-)
MMSLRWLLHFCLDVFKVGMLMLWQLVVEVEQILTIISPRFARKPSLTQNFERRIISMYTILDKGEHDLDGTDYVRNQLLFFLTTIRLFVANLFLSFLEGIQWAIRFIFSLIHEKIFRVQITIKHEIDVDAPIEKVWETLTNLNEWDKWSKWTKFEMKSISPGVNGKMFMSFDGNDKWKSFDFTLREVDKENHLLRWGGGLGPIFQGNHWFKLTSNGDKTHVFHSEQFSGLAPALGKGMPYAKMDRNYRLINEKLKEYVEKSS